MSDPRFPIGQFEHSGPVSAEDVNRWIRDIEELPAQMREAAHGLTEEQLAAQYRPGSWTVRQIIHHVPDSHLNSYVRFKWALTEEEPVIKAYDENGWASLADYSDTPVDLSLDFLETLHAKWVVLLRSLTDKQLSRRFVHPESGPTELAWSIGAYSWHGRHHLAHITSAIAREEE